MIVTVKRGLNVGWTIVFNFPMISLVQGMIAAMTLLIHPNVALEIQTGLAVQKPTDVEKDLGTVTQIANVKKALNVGRIIVMIMELSLVQVMTAASSLVVKYQSQTH